MTRSKNYPREKEHTYNTQVGEIRSHSFSLFLPEGDFAPEAHCEPNI